MIGPCFVGFVVALVGCGLSLRRLVFSCNSVWAPLSLFGCSFLGFGVFSVGFAGCCRLALGASDVYFLCT
jgi:hypothetical protein